MNKGISKIFPVIFFIVFISSIAYLVLADTAPSINHANITSSQIETNNTFQNLTVDLNVTESDLNFTWDTLANWYENTVPLIVLNLPFNNETGLDNVTVDVSGLGNGGTLGNITPGTQPTINLTNGFYGKGIYFDGVNDFLNISGSSSLDFTDEMSFDIWIKPISITSSSPLITNRNTSGGTDTNYHFYLRDSSAPSRIGFYNGTEFATTNNVIVENEWQHIAVTVKGDAMSFYYNGILEETISASLGPVNDYNLYSGWWPGNNTYFNGYMDGLRLWNRSLSSSQVWELYKGNDYGFTRAINETVLDIDFNDGSATDFSGFDNDGSLSGNPAINSTNGFYGVGAFFDGINGKVGITDSPSIRIANNSFSVSLWVKPETGQAANADTIGIKSSIGGNAGWVYRANEGNFFLNDGSTLTTVSGNSAPSNVWTYAVLVIDRNADTANLYVNGILSGTESIAGSGGYEIEQGIGIGQIDISTRTFNGSLDEVKIFNRTLEYKEILDLYNTSRKFTLTGDETSTGRNYSAMLVSTDGINYSSAINTTSFAVLDVPSIIFANITTTNVTTNATTENITFGIELTTEGPSTLYNTTCNIFENGVSLLLSVFNFNINGTDCSGLNNHFSLFGNANISFSGLIGKGLELEGIDSKVNTTTRLDLDLVTIEFWFNPNQNYDNASSQNLSVISYQGEDDYEIFIENGSLNFAYKGWNLSSTTVNWTKDRWYYIATTFDGEYQRLYVDGLLESEFKTKTYVFRNSTNSALATFYNNGDIEIKGTCQVETICNPDENSLIFQNSTGPTLFHINSTGGICTIDDCSGNDNSCNDPGDGSLIIQNLRGDNVAYVGAGGNFCFKGNLFENGNP